MPNLKARWNNVLHGFWFVPGTLVVGLAALALLLVRLDRSVATGEIGFLYSGDAPSASGILSTIAGATATIAGVVFSITIVTLQLVSSQFSPRALRGFMKDHLNQATAGVFVGTFVYCLLVLRTIRSPDDGGGEFVPALAITTATFLGLLSLLVLIVFIHHVSSSIQASSIAEKLAGEAAGAIDRLYPDPYGDPEEDEDVDALLASWGNDAVEARAPRPGFVQAVALEELVDAVAEPGTRMHVTARPGDFVTPADVVVRVWDGSCSEDELISCVEKTIVVGAERDSHDDVAFGLRQLSDVAVRALSPGMNDPTTARTCLGYLRAAMERLAERRDPPAVRRFDEGVVAVVDRPSFEELLGDAFGEIAHHGAGQPRVALGLLAAVLSVAEAAVRSAAWARVAHVIAFAEEIEPRILEKADSGDERERLSGALAAIRGVARGAAQAPR